MGAKDKSMKILMATQCRATDLSFERTPRGWGALPHYWRLMGADVLQAWRDDLIRPYRLFRLLRGFRPDIVVTGWLAAPVIVFLRRVGAITVPVVHAWDDYYDEQSAWPKWVVGPLEKYSVIHADFVTSPSRFNISKALHWGVPCRYVPHGSDSPGVVPQGVDVPRLTGKFIIVYSGNQSTYQRTERLIESVRGMDCDLYIFGRINEAMKAVAPENAHFMGMVEQSLLPYVYAQADVLAHTSDQDSTFKVFDYIRARKPILALSGRVEYFLKHGETAYITEDLREGIRTLSADRALCAHLVAQVSSIPCFSWENVSRIMLSVFKQVVQNGPQAVCTNDLSDRQYGTWTNVGGDINALRASNEKH